MTQSAAIDRGRKSFQRRAWGEAFAHLQAADRETPLDPPELEQLATSAHLLGREEESTDFLTRAYQGYVDAGQIECAARAAFWIGFGLFTHGEPAQGGGWLARARRLVDESGRECVESGYLLVSEGIRAVRDGDAAAALAAFTEAADVGVRFADRDLTTLARHGQGRALIRLSETDRGVALLDEAMVAVTAGEVAPAIVGGVYCSVIEACHEIFDFRRAQEWTAALTAWCESQPDLVTHRGQCLVRRAEIMQMHGAWPDAVQAAELARRQLSDPKPQPGAGAAIYRLAELHRMRGNLSDAEAAYRQASQWGQKPEPGLALLRLAQGRTDLAYAAIRRVADEASGSVRCPVLAAFVEIALAAGDVAAAAGAAEELEEIATRLGAPFVRAVAGGARGMVLVAARDFRGALVALGRAATLWRDLDVPYEGARTSVQVALACRALGDEDTAMLELEFARRVFGTLGAATELARVEHIIHDPAGAQSGPLTTREREVLGLVAAGKTNRAIAATLGISEKTVARHVSNIFTKLGLSSRAAATAYAYQHHLVRSQRA